MSLDIICLLIRFRSQTFPFFSQINLYQQNKTRQKPHKRFQETITLLDFFYTFSQLLCFSSYKLNINLNLDTKNLSL